MIVAEQVQKSMEGKHPNLGGHVVPGPASLTPGDTTGNHHIPKRSRLIGGKRQHIRQCVFATKLAVELLNAAIRRQRNRQVPPRSDRRDAAQPPRDRIRLSPGAHYLHAEAVRHTSPPLKES